jgi:hypothetical protein
VVWSSGTSPRQLEPASAKSLADPAGQSLAPCQLRLAGWLVLEDDDAGAERLHLGQLQGLLVVVVGEQALALPKDDGGGP